MPLDTTTADRLREHVRKRLRELNSKNGNGHSQPVPPPQSDEAPAKKNSALVRERLEA